MFRADIIYASFSKSVPEASAATTSSSSVRRPPRRAFRLRAEIPRRIVFNEDTEMPDVDVEVEAATFPSLKRARSFSPSPPSKRRLLLSSTTRHAPATAVWCASACDHIADLEKNRVLFLISELVAHVSFPGFGQSLSLWFEEHLPHQSQTIEIRLLCLGAAPVGQSSRKRPLEQSVL